MNPTRPLEADELAALAELLERLEALRDNLARGQPAATPSNLNRCADLVRPILEARQPTKNRPAKQ